MSRENYIKKVRIVLLALAFGASLSAQVPVLNQNTATTIAPMRLYGDSSFVKPTEKIW